MSNQTQKDDALFEALGKSKKKKRRKIIVRLLATALILALALVLAATGLQRRVRQQFASAKAEVLSETVTRGSISTLVSGRGILLHDQTESLTVPEGVEVTEILVDFGDSVEPGKLLALTDDASVRTTLSEIQTQIEDLDDQLRSAESDRVNSYINAGVAGRIKAIYAEPGSSVADVMMEHGALALISLDGKMAVTLETGALAEGDNVSVLREDGSKVTGTVESAAGGKATVLVTDNGPRMGETVSVFSAEGTQLGSGTLSIHSPLAVTGFAGTVRTVAVKENAQVYASSAVLYLSDTAHSANYDTLLRQREEAEETLLELLTLRKYGGLTAPVSGSVLSVADLDSEEGYTELVVLSTDIRMSVTISVDESDILALELGQQADVTVSALGEESLTGVVTEIDKTASDGSYTAVITLEKTEGMLQGMSAEVDIRIQGVDGALVIPVDALQSSGTGSYVFTDYDEENGQYGGRVDVTTGLRNSSFVEITSGLEEGDTVYYTESQSSVNPMFGMGGSRGGQSGGNWGGQAEGGRGQSGGFPGGQSGGFPGGSSSGGFPGGNRG